MSLSLSPAEAGKFAAARRSVDFVEDGMRLGLGTGSTAAWMVRCLAKRARDEQLDLLCVPTSEATERLARALGLTVTTLDEAGHLDLTIDGADEFDPSFNLIKGGGGAHLREKIVAAASQEMLVITDPSKDVAALGAFPLPIEVLRFGLASTRSQIEAVLAEEPVAKREIRLRGGNDPLVTDEGNFIIDAHLGRIDDPEALAVALNKIPGVVENGLFLGMCRTIVIGREDGSVETRTQDGSKITDVDMAEAETLPGGPE
ncbi:ribose-5-phosphate isomerase RpiA [Qingshengfaniella alkalisoli]|uniref:Ribose-5-phosphate isomerase A n=1 Tax=Qingshengfaniella alkalisoli TaxID=2599296 RepID=A0A5B8I9G0_9RHOB|nr:ribose-5-phosphate isomerase RpiA [Qingshengfaniella alkalisoli]QDY69586.1 ribose-5-phosphate isomerase RpiA [Qingshengfaniella alkalisoli]